MKSFLQLVAETLLQRYSNNLSGLTVVFPGKRASLFLDQALAEASSVPVWSPTYKTISEIFEEASAYKVCEPVESVCRLYRAYSHHVTNPKTLDQFYSWGEILLADFDDLDKHLVDVHQLFANIRDLHQLDDTSYITPEQEEALRAFFSNFSLQNNSELKEHFLHLWEKMPAIYDELNASMRQDGVLYEGAIQRAVVTAKKGILVSDATSYVFVGFNVLNAVEQALFDNLQHLGKALFFWDYDMSYVKPNSHEYHEAGYFLRQNLERYGNELSPECFDNFREPKQLDYVVSSSENAQARFIPQWLSHHLTECENQTAIVLCNEQLLQPVLHSLPNPKMPVNVTMGFPLSDTSVYSFILELATLQIEGYDAASDSFRYASLRSMISHPYIRYIDEGCWKRRSEGGVALLSYLQEMLMQLAKHISGDMIAQEALYRVYTRLNRLVDLMSGTDPLLCVNDVTLLRVLRSILQSETLPFHGEPAIGLQLMGVLETRALDFKNILMLSVGEGYLPKNVSDSSFIPYYLRDAFGLTTLRHKIAVYAYYFYRLIQRAEHVTFVYNESNAGTRQNEMSRFLRQLLAETDLPIRQYKLQASSVVTLPSPIIKQKTPEIVEQLIKRYDNRGKVGKERRFLSPSALNTYTTCSLKFYYRYIEEIRVDPDPQDGLDAILFGEVFHRAAELLYHQLISAGDVIRMQDIDTFLEMDGQRIEPFVRQAFREKFFMERREDYRGILYIAYRVIHTYLLQLLRHDRRHTPFRVLGLEVPQIITMKIGDLEVDTGGIVDRLDLVSDENVMGGQAIRVVDYKTGGRPEVVSSLDRLFFETDQKSHYYFQTILYSMIVAEQRGMAVTPCLFFVHKSGSEDYSPKLKLGGQIIHDVRQPFSKEQDELALSDAFMDNLRHLIAEIFDVTKPFCQTNQENACENCEFRQICSR